MTETVMDNVSDTSLNQENTIAPQERIFKQSELNEIVGRAKHEAVESFKRQQTQHVTSAPQTQQTQSQNQRQLSEDDVKRLTSEELSRQREQWAREHEEKVQMEEAQRVVNKFWEKMAPGKEIYEDFDSVAGNIKFQSYPNVVHLLVEHVDNVPEVLYELGKNRLKLSELENASYHNVEDAIYEIKRLSNSIKANDSVSNVRTPNAPLSQQRPSNLGTDSGTTLSMADLKRKYRG